MNLHRCSSVFHICRQSSPPKLLSHFKSSISSLAHPSPTSSSSSLQIRLFWLNHPLRTRTRAFTTAVSSVPDGNVTTAASSVPDGNVSDTFFAEEGVSWTSVGVSDVLSRSLSNVGIERPSLVQAACIPTILSGKDVVIAAETGSGKTHGYLVPLFEKLYGTPYDSGSTTAGQEWSLPRKVSVVLCPNVMLCDQVVRMANGLCDDNGDPILRVSAICGRQGWPAHMPDIVVSTPAALLNNLRSIDPEKRRLSDFIRGVKYVVFDEADLLLCGSFQNQVVRLINMFRFDEKQLSRSKTSIPKEPLEFDSESLLQLDPEYEEDLQGNATLEGDENVEHGVGVEDEIDSARAKRKDWRRVRKYYERSKQYIFVAATLPVNGKQTAGGILKRMFPDANWVSGTYLHCHNPRLKHKWVEVTVDTQVGALIDALDEGSRSKLLSSGGVSRTIVFANTVEAVEAVAKILQGAGIECFHYHSDSSLEERAKTLVDFQKQGGILVCTDAASRGLDIPKVSHVIQADFATSALDFLHRVGRAGRAGQFGLVTSMYTESNRDLVNAIRQAWKLGQPVEMAFSRKRSFRKKIKKRAGYNKAAEILTAEEKVAA